ncbi:MAG TPA: NAD(P)H-binding protein [Ktedonobacterales bacterium]|jgi:uncharacterized protein YbjT (DUF2867 family)|nr:NAD(P)H-binding protein [Ktedonobacterales bacterium]
MGTLLVTGGTGHLGRDLIPELQRAGHHVRALTRRPRHDAETEWVVGDLGTGEGLDKAMAGVDQVVNAATNSPMAQRGGFRLSDFFRTPSDVDLQGVRRLIESAKRTGVRRFLHVSIVAIDRANYPYGRVKAAGERLVRESELDWAVVRATPFYYLIAGWLSGLARMPVWPLPVRLPFQPCDSADFATHLARCVDDGELGMRQDFGGPEVLTIGGIARQYQVARAIKRPIIPLPLGPLAGMLQPMFPTAPQGVRGTTSWSTWLSQKPDERHEASPTPSSHDQARAE